MELNEIPEITGVNESKESSRKIIAYSITAAFVLFILISLLFAVIGSDVDHFKNGKELISTIGSVFGGLVGAVVGFYFGTNSSETR